MIPTISVPHHIVAVSDVTSILGAVERGETAAAEELLPLVYEELRKLAGQKMAREPAGHTLQATALVHEAYLRLVGQESQAWENSRHFFSAAAEAMRRILVERARRKGRIRHGGQWQQVSLEDIEVAIESEGDTVLFVHEALEKLALKDPVCAELIKLRYFAGVSNVQAAAMLGLSDRTAKRDWAYARAWLAEALREQSDA